MTTSDTHESTVREGRREPFKQLPDAVMDDDNLSPEAKLLYWYFVRVAGWTDNRARVSIAAIAAKFRLAPSSKRTVRRWIDELVTAGWVDVIHRKSSDGKTNYVSDYIVHKTPPGEGVGAGEHPGWELGSTQVGAGEPPVSRSYVSRSKEPLSSEVADATTDGDTSLFAVPDQPPVDGEPKDEGDPSFEAFWKVYPRKIGKKLARQRWKAAVKKKSSAELIKDAERYAARRAGQDPQYTLHASTWLGQERWNDEPGNGAGLGSDSDSVKAWLREQHRNGLTGPVEERTGMRYFPPPLPDHVTTKEQGIAFHADAAREWIKTNHEQMIQRILDRESRGVAS